MSKTGPENLSDKQMFSALQSDGKKALEQLYVAYRSDFIAYAKKYESEEADILDVYQDAIIALYENVCSGKINSLSSSVKTYLFSIGKFKLFDKLKAKGKLIPTEKVDQLNKEVDTSFVDKLELTHRQKLLRGAIDRLGGKCKDLLILFYYHRYSIKSIQKEMNYKNENTVKANKSRCMKSLREIILKLDL